MSQSLAGFLGKFIKLTQTCGVEWKVSSATLACWCRSQAREELLKEGHIVKHCPLRQPWNGEWTGGYRFRCFSSNQHCLHPYWFKWCCSSNQHCLHSFLTPFLCLWDLTGSGHHQISSLWLARYRTEGPAIEMLGASPMDYLVGWYPFDATPTSNGGVMLKARTAKSGRLVWIPVMSNQRL